MTSALVTDLYELTIAASYLRRRTRQPATFNLFVRRPLRRSAGAQAVPGQGNRTRPQAGLPPAGINDVIGLCDEVPPEGAEPLLQPVMISGCRVHPPEPPAFAREQFAVDWPSCPPRPGAIHSPTPVARWSAQLTDPTSRATGRPGHCRPAGAGSRFDGHHLLRSRRPGSRSSVGDHGLWSAQMSPVTLVGNMTGR